MPCSEQCAGSSEPPLSAFPSSSARPTPATFKPTGTGRRTLPQSSQRCRWGRRRARVPRRPLRRLPVSHSPPIRRQRPRRRTRLLTPLHTRLQTRLPVPHLRPRPPALAPQVRRRSRSRHPLRLTLRAHPAPRRPPHRCQTPTRMPAPIRPPIPATESSARICRQPRPHRATRLRPPARNLPAARQRHHLIQLLRRPRPARTRLRNRRRRRPRRKRGRSISLPRTSMRSAAELRSGSP
jgi:hypothetical protein